MPERRRISTPRTAGRFGVVLSMALVLLMVGFWLRGDPGVVWGVLFALGMMALVFWSYSRQRTVSMDGDFLYLESGKSEVKVSFADVLAVEEHYGRPRRSVALRLRRSCGEKLWVWFRLRLATGASTWSPWYRRSHPAVEELKARIGDDRIGPDSAGG